MQAVEFEPQVRFTQLTVPALSEADAAESCVRRIFQNDHSDSNIQTGSRLIAAEISIRRHDGDREGRAGKCVEDVVEAPVHGGDHHTPGERDEQVREPALVPPRHQAHDNRTRHVRAGKRAAARAAARRYLMNEIEEEVAGERRSQALRQVVRAVYRQQDEKQVARQQHGREQQQQLAEGRQPPADVPSTRPPME